MRHPIFDAIIFVAICALSSWANGQNAYKCGSTYSQTPCPDGVPVATGDTRTEAQKRQTESATSLTARTADAMEKDRLAQEKRDLAANRSAAPSTTPGTQAPTHKEADKPPGATAKKKKKKNEPEYFTAQVPGEKKHKEKAAKAVKTAKAAKAAKSKKAADQKS